MRGSRGTGLEPETGDLPGAQASLRCRPVTLAAAAGLLAAATGLLAGGWPGGCRAVQVGGYSPSGAGRPGRIRPAVLAILSDAARPAARAPEYLALALRGKDSWLRQPAIDLEERHCSSEDRPSS